MNCQKFSTKGAPRPNLTVTSVPGFEVMVIVEAVAVRVLGGYLPFMGAIPQTENQPDSKVDPGSPQIDAPPIPLSRGTISGPPMRPLGRRRRGHSKGTSWNTGFRLTGRSSRRCATAEACGFERADEPNLIDGHHLHGRCKSLAMTLSSSGTVDLDFGHAEMAQIFCKGTIVATRHRRGGVCAGWPPSPPGWWCRVRRRAQRC